MSSFTHRSTDDATDDGSGRVALIGIFVVMAVLAAGVGLLTR